MNKRVYKLGNRGQMEKFLLGADADGYAKRQKVLA